MFYTILIMRLLRHLFLAIALLSALPVLAQTNIAPPPTFHFVTGGDAIGFSSGSGNNPGSIAWTGLQVTANITTSYMHLTVPGISVRAELGVASYTTPLSSILGKTLSSKLLFDSTNLNVTCNGGAGKWFGASKNGVAETGGCSLSYPLPGTSASLQLFGLQYVHAPGTNGLITRNEVVPSAGLMFAW